MVNINNCILWLFKHAMADDSLAGATFNYNVGATGRLPRHDQSYNWGHRGRGCGYGGSGWSQSGKGWIQGGKGGGDIPRQAGSSRDVLAATALLQPIRERDWSEDDEEPALEKDVDVGGWESWDEASKDIRPSSEVQQAVLPPRVKPPPPSLRPHDAAVSLPLPPRGKPPPPSFELSLHHPASRRLKAKAVPSVLQQPLASLPPPHIAKAPSLGVFRLPFTSSFLPDSKFTRLRGRNFEDWIGQAKRHGVLQTLPGNFEVTVKRHADLCLTVCNFDGFLEVDEGEVVMLMWAKVFLDDEGLESVAFVQTHCRHKPKIGFVPLLFLDVSDVEEFMVHIRGRDTGRDGVFARLGMVTTVITSQDSELDSDLVMVTGIEPNSLIAAWNKQHRETGYRPRNQVMMGDFISWVSSLPLETEGGYFAEEGLDNPLQRRLHGWDGRQRLCFRVSRNLQPKIEREKLKLASLPLTLEQLVLSRERAMVELDTAQ